MKKCWSFRSLCSKPIASAQLVRLQGGNQTVKGQRSHVNRPSTIRLLLLVQVLASDVNIGYEEIVNTQVHQVNGKPIKNLSDLTKQIEGCKDEYLRFDLEYNQVFIAASVHQSAL